MLPYKNNVRIFIIEFACVVFLQMFYAFTTEGIETGFMMALGLVPGMILAVLAWMIKNEAVVLRLIYSITIITFFFLAQSTGTYASLPLMYLAVAVTLCLFINMRILIEYSTAAILMLVGVCLFHREIIAADNMYIIYIMLYAFASVALVFIASGVRQYQKDMEEKNEIAKDALEAKGNFLANMSHEIRTPMNAIYGMAELLETQNLGVKEKGYIAVIKRSSDNLLSIINEILDFSKVDSGKMTLTPDSYDFNTMIQDVVTIIRFRMREKNIELIQEIDKNIPKVLYGDSIRVRQILINLLNNAVKFTNRGSITLRINWVMNSNLDGSLYIDVEDTGIGISEENLAKLFTAFGQLNTKKNRNVEGTGLGLAIVKNLVDLMRGKIQVHSVLNAGSCFEVQIPQGITDHNPCNYEPGNGTTLEESEQYNVSFCAPGAKVLVVDDNKVNRVVAGELLALFRIEAHFAESGQEAIDKVDKQLVNYDIIFMDHMMPYMDGVEATKQIRKLAGDYAKSVPIIALTANAIKGVEAQFLTAGMNDFLAKPIDVALLDEILVRWLPADKRYSPDLTMEEIAAKQANIDYSKMSPEEIIKHLDGLDTKEGIKNCAGSISVYFDLLRAYATSNMVNLLQMHFEQEDMQNYALTAHSIKGASKNIGATEVAELAYMLERAGNRGDIEFIWDNHEAFYDAYRGMIMQLKKIFFSEF
ncbi:MAG: ATP-binding protein [Lachnospiraceae bacterium]|nr:ATP-binding protein [Lachnospiraceae bacterium]